MLHHTLRSPSPKRSATACAAGLLLALATGCADTVPLCDGSDGLTLRVFTSGGGPSYPGGQVREELGIESFAVDGQCRYYINGAWSGGGPAGFDEGWRMGELTSGLRRELESWVGKEDLSTLDCDDTVPLDAPASIIANTRSSTDCRGAAVFAELDRRAQVLREQGLPLYGDLHVAVWSGYGDADPSAAYAWPSELSLRDYFEPDPSVFDTPGSSRRVLAPAAAPLRALREQFLSDVSEGRIEYSPEGIPVTDGSISARLFMRDALPYEDDHGLWPLPGE